MLANSTLTGVEIKRIGKEQAEKLSGILNSAPAKYTQYFEPFNFDFRSVYGILNNAISDLYFGVFVKEELCGFYMLRGFDSGFEIPSYGVWISPDFSGMGLATLTLSHCFVICKLNGIKKIILKVHPENRIAKKIYERYGFVQIGLDDKNKNLIFQKIL